MKKAFSVLFLLSVVYYIVFRQSMVIFKASLTKKDIL